MAHELLRLLCLEYKVVDYQYFMNEMELWEAYLIAENLQYSDRSIWESARLIAYMTAQVNSKKKIKFKDIVEFEWEKKPKNMKQESITKAEIQERKKAFLNKINNG